MNARLLRAYRRSAYEAAGAVARIGQRSPGIDALLRRLGSRTGGLVTAWNPFSRKRPLGWNTRMQQRLVTTARRLPQASGHGSGPRWREAHGLFACDVRRLRVLARRFRQAGIVELRQGAPARLVWLSPGRR